MKGRKRDAWLADAHSEAKRGEQLPQSRLTVAKVREIRAAHVPYCRTNGAPALARRYGLHRRTVEKVLAYESWAHA